VCEPDPPRPAAASAPPAAAPGGSVTLSREELVRLVAEAVERFRT